jgi:hypothetical protein
MIHGFFSAFDPNALRTSNYALREKPGSAEAWTRNPSLSALESARKVALPGESPGPESSALKIG